MILRAVRNSSEGGNFNHYQFDKQTKQLRLTSAAFSDRVKKPSVDIAYLNHFCYEKSQLGNEANGVVALRCGEIRTMDDIREIKDNQEKKYYLDVIHRPIPANPAHAQIEPMPEYDDGSKIFRKKVTKSLARIATKNLNSEGWVIKPESLREE